MGLRPGTVTSLSVPYAHLVHRSGSSRSRRRREKERERILRSVCCLASRSVPSYLTSPLPYAPKGRASEGVRWVEGKGVTEGQHE